MGLPGQVVHRSGPLKQANKKHKSASKSSAKTAKGKIGVKAISHSQKQDLNRKDRKHQANQLRKNKRDAVVMKKRGLGASNAPPILVVILPINGSVNAAQFLEKLKSCDDDITATSNDSGYCHLSSSRLKQRFNFVIPKYQDLHSVMDLAKVADTLLFIHSQETYTDYTEKLLSLILAHACPSTVHIVQGLEGLSPKKKSDIKKEITKKMEARFSDEKLLHADTRQELQLLLRQIGIQKQRSIKFRDSRPHLLAEKVSFELNDPDAGLGTLQVLGYIRGKALNVHSLIHIPGWGDFQMSQIVYNTDPHSVTARKRKASSKVLDEEMTESELRIDKANPEYQESLQSEIIPDPMDNEQTWPTEEELQMAMEPQKIAKKVVEGTSEYQAAWIVDEEEEDDDDDSDDQDNASDSGSMITATEGLSDEENMDSDDGEFSECKELKTDENVDYDKDTNMEEENKMRVRFREERMEQLFPDEIDTPIDVPARIRYQRYRGLKNFSAASWDPMENLPPDYGRIYRFENFQLTKKRVFKAERDGAEPGSYVTLHIMNVPQSLYDGIEKDEPLVIFGLLPHEQKMSVMNVVIKKHPLCKIPIKSKDSLIFHVGFRRFVCQPIFSAHHSGNKYKYERYLPIDTAVVASFYAPVIFPPASVAVLRQGSDGQHELVATGNVMNVDPNRIVVKRIVLSGHPFKIFTKSAVVRYMFFNREDIDWFKRVELKTKCGRKGNIKEALGSHGHMKCVFDRQLPSQDVVLMNLYKRVFPKWTYEAHVPTPLSPNEDNMETVVV